MTGHNAVNPRCIDFTGKDALMKEETFTEELSFLENARVLFSLSLNQSGTRIEETALILLNVGRLCHEVYAPTSLLDRDKKEDSPSNSMGSKYHKDWLHSLFFFFFFC